MAKDKPAHQPKPVPPYVPPQSPPGLAYPLQKGAPKVQERIDRIEHKKR